MEKFVYVVLLPQYPTFRTFSAEADSAKQAAQIVRDSHPDVLRYKHWMCVKESHVSLASHILWEQWKTERETA